MGKPPAFWLGEDADASSFDISYPHLHFTTNDPNAQRSSSTISKQLSDRMCDDLLQRLAAEGEVAASPSQVAGPSWLVVLFLLSAVIMFVLIGRLGPKES